MSTRKRAQIESLIDGLSQDEQLALIEHIARRLRQSEERKPQPLYGIWKGKLPADVDVNAALKEIRQQWKEDFGEFNK